MLLDKKSGFFRKLVSDHVSGQLKVAPEHCSPQVLGLMGKPPIEVYEKFKDEYFRLCAECGKEQYLVPYLMSSHPGSTEKDAQILHEYIKTWGYDPEQVQDFYPTPGTASTCMFWTGLDPFTGKPVYVPRSPEEKRTQKKLLHVERKNHRTKKDHN
ncbi:hypothetical protein SDC9_143805 [bioreactor metagenome]|uniref:UPF0313 domain-containing protein n=1 Tax=bioreactor metagenome TaxID=1076179 RepID=A0A645E4E0_9ZZZZ